MTAQEIKPTDLAVIGIACMFPGADNKDEFWKNIWNSRESIVSGGIDSTGTVKAAATISNIASFDADFFGISAREAELTDPQHRKFLECCWSALEDAGIDPAKYKGTVGVFGGVGISSYLINNVIPAQNSRKDRNFIDSSEDLKLLIANDKDYFSSRVSYKLDLRGPSLNIQAACATSLFAIHAASQAILAGECDTAIAGAACIPVPQIQSYQYEPDMVFSSDGHCRPFDSMASGTVFGSGVGAVILKLATEAIKDGDRIYALIKGSAVNNDGATKVGMTAPSIWGQSRVIREAIDVSGISSEEISYVETHGTATPLGDPIEIMALTKAFASEKRGFCSVGSVKANIGHTGWASGMAGFIKTCLALYHRKLPSSINFDNPNSQISFSDTPFYIQKKSEEWKTAGLRRAGVSSFGLGGNNGHIVLEELSENAGSRKSSDKLDHIVTLSGRTPEALQRNILSLKSFLKENPDLSISDISFTRNVRSRHHDYRTAYIARDINSLYSQLDAQLSNDENQQANKIAFLFPGQGCEYARMGEALYSTYPLFRSEIDSMESVFKDAVGISLKETLYSKSSNYGDSFCNLSVTQPLLFSFEVALARLWLSWGVKPSILIGHSLGEYAAACIAGVFSPEDGIRITARRGRLIETVQDGGMLVAFSSAEKISNLISSVKSDVSISSVNSPASIVVGGRKESIDQFQTTLSANSIEYKRVNINRAGHCSLLDPILDQFEDFLGSFVFSEPTIPIASNISGDLVGNKTFTPFYWREHLRQSVQFKKCIETAIENGITCYLEIGPSSSSISMATENLEDYSCISLSSLSPKENADLAIIGSLADLYKAGCSINWKEFHNSRPGQKISLPTYSFDTTSYWIEPPSNLTLSHATAGLVEGYGIEWQRINLNRQYTNQNREYLVFIDDSDTSFNITRDSFLKEDQNISFLKYNSEFNKESFFNQLRPYINNTRLISIFFILSAGANGKPVIYEHGQLLLNDFHYNYQIVLYFLQALANLQPQNITTYIFTKNAQLVTENDGFCPDQIGISGLIKTAIQEHPELNLVQVDRETIEIKPDLVDFALNREEFDRCLAIRAGGAYKPILKRKTYINNSKLQSENNGYYLIAGGLRGLGFEIAKGLIKSGIKKIILVGRSTPAEAVCKEINDIKMSGVDIEWDILDISSYLDANTFLGNLKKKGISITGIISTVASINDATILNSSKMDQIDSMRSKVSGNWNLHRLSIKHDLKLNTFVLFSSASSLFGNAGQASYVAANIFVDQLVEHRIKNGLPGTSINWGPWSDGGHLKNNPDILNYLQDIGYQVIDLESGMKRFLSVLGLNGVVGLFELNWKKFIESRSATDSIVSDLSQGFLKPCDTVQKSISARDSLAGKTPSESKEILLKEIAAVWEKVVGIKTSDTGYQLQSGQFNFLEHGLDSLQAIQIRNNLQKRLEISLPANICYKHITSDLLATHLANMTGANNNKFLSTNVSLLKADNHRDLSLQQQRWLSLNSKNYGRLVTTISFSDFLDLHHLLNALRIIVNNHEILRWKFYRTHAEVRSAEEVLPDNIWDTNYHDLTALKDNLLKNTIEEIGQDLWLNMPDPLQEMPWKICVIKLSDSQFLLLLSLQHLEFDGTSISIFVDELREAYKLLRNGKKPTEESTQIQYKDYVEWQKHYIKYDIEIDRSFFTGFFASSNTRTLLPGHSGELVTESFDSDRFTLPVKSGLADKVRSTAIRNHVSSFAVISTVYAKMISEIVREPQVTIGTIMNGRADEKFRRVIGPFVAPFPLPFNTNLPFETAVKYANSAISFMNAKSEYPPADMVRNVPQFQNLPFDTYYTDPFIMFNNYEREFDDPDLKAETLECLAPQINEILQGLDARSLPEIAGLFLIIDIVDRELRFNFWYHRHRFNPNTIKRWARRFEEILEISSE